MADYYYHGRSGDSFEEATIHESSVCCPDPARPIAESTVDSLTAPEWCPDCTPFGDDSDSDLEPSESESEMLPRDIEQLIEGGECPWCDSYSGDHVGQHASSAHPQKWQAYKERTE